MSMARVRRYSLALLMGAALLAASVLSVRESFVFVRVDRSNVCDWSESTRCFENEPGIVTGGDG